MYNFFFFGLCVLSTITSSFGLTNSFKPTDPNEVLESWYARANGTDPLLFGKEVLEDLEKRQTGLTKVEFLQDRPYNAVGFIVAEKDVQCIATLVGPYHVLVPAHCIHKDGNFLNSNELYFTFARDIASRFGIQKTIVHPLWRPIGHPDYDLGLVYLADRPNVNPFRYGVAVNFQGKQEMSIVTCPWEEQPGNLWYTTRQVTNTLRFDTNDIWGSHDGSPIYRDNVLYGIISHSWKQEGAFNYRVLPIIKINHDFIWSWIEGSDDEHPCLLPSRS